ncbi:MAG TPA: peroxiredoxin family protein [Acidobacteriota bacterium]|nr:peroxiredoxin family protein [Acidobacteriota bacterium]
MSGKQGNKLILFIVALAATALILAVIPSTKASQDNTWSAAKDDRPLITSFKITAKKLQKNRINWVTVEFTFKDEKRNLRGGTMTINFQYSKTKGRFFNYALTDRAFKQKNGSYSLSFGLLGENMKQVTIWAWMRDAGGTAGNESEYITLTLMKKNPKGGKQGYRVGQKAYDFTLLDQSGNEVKLSDYKGKVIWLDFSTGWCTYCANEAADHNEFKQKYGDELEIITVLTEGVSYNWANSKDCKQWAKRFKLTSPVLADLLAGVYYGYTRYGDTMSYPYNFIIDKKGIIRWKKIGYMDDGSTKAKIESKIIELLNE